MRIKNCQNLDVQITFRILLLWRLGRQVFVVDIEGVYFDKFKVHKIQQVTMEETDLVSRDISVAGFFLFFE
jgi:hypothetical protein